VFALRWATSPGFRAQAVLRHPLRPDLARKGGSGRWWRIGSRGHDSGDIYVTPLAGETPFAC